MGAVTDADGLSSIRSSSVTILGLLRRILWKSIATARRAEGGREGGRRPNWKLRIQRRLDEVAKPPTELKLNPPHSLTPPFIISELLGGYENSISLLNPRARYTFRGGRACHGFQWTIWTVLTALFLNFELGKSYSDGMELVSPCKVAKNIIITQQSQMT